MELFFAAALAAMTFWTIRSREQSRRIALLARVRRPLRTGGHLRHASGLKSAASLAGIESRATILAIPTGVLQ